MEKAQQEQNSFVSRIDMVIPQLKYCGMALWLAWIFVAYSANIWISSDVEETSMRISEMFSLSTLCFAATLLISAAFSSRLFSLLTKGAAPIIGGSLGTIGTLLIILAMPSLFPSLALFSIGCSLTGVGTALLCIRVGLLFVQLGPRRSLLLLSGSFLIAVSVYFALVSQSIWLGRVLFVVLLLFAGMVLSLGEAIPPDYKEDIEKSPLPLSLWRSLLAIFVLSATGNLGKGYYTLQSPFATGEIGALAMLVSAGVVLLALLLVILLEHVVKLETMLYFSSVGFICTMVGFPLLGVDNVVVHVALTVSYNLFDLVVWMLLFLTVRQACLSPLKVVGFGRAAVALGVTVGNHIGLLAVSGADIHYASLVISCISICLLIMCIFVVFPLAQIRNLFASVSDKDEPFIDMDTARRDSWRERCRKIGEKANLSSRELEIMELLAKGRGGEYIAEELCISIFTVRSHTRNIYSKLNVHSRKELITLIERQSE